jgi:hypothetical protein
LEVGVSITAAVPKTAAVALVSVDLVGFFAMM